MTDPRFTFIGPGLVAPPDPRDAEIAALRARLAAVEAENATLAAACAAWRDKAERVEAALARAREVLREVEWDRQLTCPICGDGDAIGYHAPDCALKAALEEKP